MLRYSIILILLSCTFYMQAQNDGLVKHWSFDGNESDYLPALRGGGVPNVADGRKGYGVYLNGIDHHFSIVEVDVKKDFTVSFWLRPLNVERTQTIFLQEKIDTKTKKTDRYLQLGIQNKSLFLKDEQSYLGIDPIPLEDGQWYFVSYSYDGFEVRITIQDQLVYKTNKVTLYNEMYQRTDEFSIGKSFESFRRFEGVLDEVKAFNLPLKKEQVNEVFEELATPLAVKELPNETVKPIEKPIQKAETVKVIEKTVDEHFKKDYRDRKNNVQHQISVTSPNIEVEVWDYDEFDEDRISIVLNNSDFIGEQSRDRLLEKKRNKQIYKFNLDKEKTNYLTFIAENMGIYDSQNTAAVRLIVEGQPFDDIYKLILTQEENAVLKITHVAKVEGKEPIVPKSEEENKATFKVVVDNQILDPLVVNSTAVTLKLKTINKSSLNQKIQVSLDDKLLKTPFVINNAIAKEIHFNVNTRKEKILLIESFQLLKDMGCNVEATVIVDGKEVKKYELSLDQNNILIPIVYVPDEVSKKPSNERYVTVSDTNLIIQIKDDAKVDGDMVTIKQEGKVILQNYTLQEELKDLNVQLNANTENTFLFVPESMGSSNGENTAYVVILLNGEVIHEFSLRSLEKYKPAKLVIVHKGN
jgi:hypothetical protein